MSLEVRDVLNTSMKTRHFPKTGVNSRTDHILCKEMGSSLFSTSHSCINKAVVKELR
jgi:hypothetical protein